MASISVSHDESYHVCRDYQLGITILLDTTAYFEHLVPSPTNLVAGGNMTKYWERRRKLGPQNVSVAINKVMDIVTSLSFSPMRLSENLLIGTFPSAPVSIS
jgi:hypothetical protein